MSSAGTTCTENESKNPMPVPGITAGILVLVMW